MSKTSQKKNTNQPTKRTNSSSSRSSQASKNTRAKSAPPPPERKPLLSSRVRNDIAGLVVAILAVVLFVIVLFPSDAIGARFISDALRLVFGQGAILMPFLLLGWSATFFIRRRLTNSPLRLALGLGIIYLAIIALFAVMTPGATANPSHIFEQELLIHQGGYVGGVLGWALLSLVGTVATTIILVGLILIGLVLIGLSITGLFDTIIRFFKSLGKKDETEFTSLNQYENANPSANGSAYQMGPQGSGAPVQSGGRRFARNSQTHADAQMLHTGVMGSEQLQNTLYQPGLDGVGNGSHETLGDLGSTRRRIVDADAEEGAASKLKTILLKSGNEYDDDILEEDMHKGEIDNELLSVEETIVLDAQKKKDAKKSKNKGKTQTAKTRETQAGFSSETVFTLPSMKLLRVSREKTATKAGVSELRSTATRLQETLEEFKVDGEVVGWIAGPTVTLYKISLGEGVRLNRITALQSDIQLALAAKAVRIVAPIPGTSLVGIEIPNQDRNEVLLGDVLVSAEDNALELAIGKDVEGVSVVADLASMPHLLIGGTTGSGKSVAINSIIMSLLMRTTPDEVRMIMIDPKRVELTLYNGIPHLYVPVVTDAGQAASALSWCVAEMDRRLKLFEKHAVKNIKQFNARVAENLANLEQQRAQEASHAVNNSAQETSDDEDATGEINTDAVNATLLGGAADDEEVDVTVEQENLRATMPYLVIVIDELADLMMLNGKEVEGAISRLAQLARAAGLHLIVATQRPSTNVITGLIKANIVNRIAFTVASGIDSRVILDTPGAEDLVGLGDMLFSRPEFSKPVRIQGCLVSEAEIETVVEYWRGQGETDYHEDILLAAPGSGSSGGGGMGGDSLEDDPLLWEAAEIVVSSQLGSTSTLQRRLKVGYARAGRIMDMLEMKGIVGPPNGSKPREVLLDDVLDLETLRAYG